MKPNQTRRAGIIPGAAGPIGKSQCICGQGMRLIAGNLYQCPACGRAKWGDESVSGTWIAVIIAMTILTLIVLAWVGISGAKYR